MAVLRMVLRVVACALVLLAVLPAGCGAGLSQVDIVAGGTHGYACFRVPTLVQAGSRLVVLAESRITDCGDQAPKDVTMMVSEDMGANWSSPVPVVGRADSPFPNATFRNPYITYYPASTELLLQYVDSTLDSNWTNLQKRSSDFGRTWSPAERVNLAPYEGVLAGPGASITLGVENMSSPWKGRTVSCGATGYHVHHAMNAVVWTSDDQGATYALSKSAFPNYQECQVVELANASLLINMRNSHLNPCDCRAQAVSHDGGTTWSPVYFVPDLVEPVCSAGLVNVGGTLYFSNPASKTSRTNMTVKASADGLHWKPVSVVYTGLSAYSVLAPLVASQAGMSTASSLGLVFEKGTTKPYQTLTFAQVPLAS